MLAGGQGRVAGWGAGKLISAQFKKKLCGTQADSPGKATAHNCAPHPKRDFSAMQQGVSQVLLPQDYHRGLAADSFVSLTSDSVL